MDQLVYYMDGFWDHVGDPRVLDYPMYSGGPLLIICIVAVYLYFIRISGPKMMEPREPYDLKQIIRLYNIIMSVVNFYVFWNIAVVTNFGLAYFGCREVENSDRENQMMRIIYIYCCTKIIELLDTIFFILRKKPNQASNLHVFHHSFIPICTWIFFKIAPGGMTIMFPILNSGVHTIMYGYYFLATFKSFYKYLWWKRYLTMAQMIQFVITMVHFSFQYLSECDYPPMLAILGFIANGVFLVLFADLYYNLYVKKKKTLSPSESSPSIRSKSQALGSKANKEH